MPAVPGQGRGRRPRRRSAVGSPAASASASAASNGAARSSRRPGCVIAVTGGPVGDDEQRDPLGRLCTRSASISATSAGSPVISMRRGRRAWRCRPRTSRSVLRSTRVREPAEAPTIVPTDGPATAVGRGVRDRCGRPLRRRTARSTAATCPGDHCGGPALSRSACRAGVRAKCGFVIADRRTDPDVISSSASAPVNRDTAAEQACHDRIQPGRDGVRRALDQEGCTWAHGGSDDHPCRLERPGTAAGGAAAGRAPRDRRRSTPADQRRRTAERRVPGVVGSAQRRR